jgi:hypothetical protein
MYCWRIHLAASCTVRVLRHEPSSREGVCVHVRFTECHVGCRSHQLCSPHPIGRGSLSCGWRQGDKQAVLYISVSPFYWVRRISITPSHALPTSTPTKPSAPHNQAAPHISVPVYNGVSAAGHQVAPQNPIPTSAGLALPKDQAVRHVTNPPPDGLPIPDDQTLRRTFIPLDGSPRFTIPENVPDSVRPNFPPHLKRPTHKVKEMGVPYDWPWM